LAREGAVRVPSIIQRTVARSASRGMRQGCSFAVRTFRESAALGFRILVRALDGSFLRGHMCVHSRGRRCQKGAQELCEEVRLTSRASGLQKLREVQRRNCESCGRGRDGQHRDRNLLDWRNRNRHRNGEHWRCVLDRRDWDRRDWDRRDWGPVVDINL